jgi:CheY-like chemotaxis protein
MDGLGVCQAIKNEPELSDTKVIITTGFPDHPKLKKIAELGFTNILPKPLDLQDFLTSVDNMILLK